VHGLVKNKKVTFLDVFWMYFVFRNLTEFSMVIVLEGKSTFSPYKFIHFLTLSATLGLWDGEGRKRMLYRNDGFIF
jgi:hypothetical protein